MRTQAVALVAPARSGPLLLTVRRGLASAAAYAHIERWLADPRVRWDPRAVALFAGARRPARLAAWVRTLAYLAPSLFAAVISAVLIPAQDARVTGSRASRDQAYARRASGVS